MSNHKALPPTEVQRKLKYKTSRSGTYYSLISAFEMCCSQAKKKKKKRCPAQQKAKILLQLKIKKCNKWVNVNTSFLLFPIHLKYFLSKLQKCGATQYCSLSQSSSTAHVCTGATVRLKSSYPSNQCVLVYLVISRQKTWKYYLSGL